MGIRQRTIERIKNKGKRMLNKAGEKYKDSVYLYMRKIIEKETIPLQFSNTSLVPIWGEKGIGTGPKNDEVYPLQRVGSKVV